MGDAEKIRGAVHRTIEAVNDLLPADQILEMDDNMVLLGRDSRLDSMGFVNFLVALEEELERELGRNVNMADLLNLQGNGHSISRLADLIDVLVKQLE